MIPSLRVPEYPTPRSAVWIFPRQEVDLSGAESWLFFQAGQVAGTRFEAFHNACDIANSGKRMLSCDFR